MTTGRARCRTSGPVIALLLVGVVPVHSLCAQNTAVIGSVRNAVTDAPVVGATLRVMPRGRSCITDGNGRCTLLVQDDTVSVTARAIGFAPLTQQFVMDPRPARAVTFYLQPSAVRLDEIVALGTRAPERTMSESPVPVDVLSSDLLQNTGQLETWQQLQRLVPSLNVPHIPIGDNHMRPITLRGLAPHHALVLVNGRRRHPAAALLAGPSVPMTSFTDLNAIPASAIERIEVLRDGASAQYGSDAIGGVVNVVLTSGAQRDLRASTGAVLSSEGGRSFSDGVDVTFAGTYGVSAPSGAHLTFSAGFQDREGTNRAYPDRRPQYFAGHPGNAASPRVSSYFGNGSVRSVSAMVSAGMPLRGRTEAYAFGGFADRNGVSPDALFRRPLEAATVRAIHPDGFLPIVTSAIGDLSAVAGLRGTWKAWRWDASAGGGESRVSYAVNQSNNVSLGAASPTQFDAGRIAAQQWTGNVDVGRRLVVARVPVNLAIGGAIRLDRFSISEGEPDSWRDGGVRIIDGPAAGQPAAVGSQGLIGFRPVDAVRADRSNSALYIEADARLIPRLLVQVAARGERYSDFGSTSDGKIATRLDVAGGVALRGSVSTGFRAPALMQEHFALTRTVFQQVNGVNTVLTVRTFPVNTPEAQLMGARPLRPEEAVNYSAGVVLDNPRFPLVTLDLYQIRIADRITLGGTVSDTSIIRLFNDNGMRGIGGGSYFANSLDTRTRGLDLVASHAVLIRGTGVLRLLAGYNRTQTVVTRVAPPPTPLAAFAPALFNRTSRGIIENGQPRETMTLTLGYTTSRLGVSVHNQRSGPTAVLDRTTPEEDEIVTARWITDARVSYQVQRRVQVSVNVANLFDVYPDEWSDFKDGLAGTGMARQGIFRYPGAISPFGINGRTVNVQVAYR